MSDHYSKINICLCCWDFPDSSTITGCVLQRTLKNWEDTSICHDSVPSFSDYIDSMSSSSSKRGDLSTYILDNDVSVASLEAKEAFDGLTSNQAHYAYYLCRASWEGAKICLLQCSVESVPIFFMFKFMYEQHGVDAINQIAEESCGFSPEDIKAFHTYASTFFTNMGNYTSFGDTKFVPNLSKEKFISLCDHFVETAQDMPPEVTAELKSSWWKDYVFDLENPRLRQLGMCDEGVSCYYSSNVTKEDASFFQGFMSEHKIAPYNTRLFKSSTKDGKTKYTLRIASSEGKLRRHAPVELEEGPDEAEKKMGDIESSEKHICVPPVEGTYEWQGCVVEVECGDYAPMMAGVVKNLRCARQYAETKNEVNFLTAYVTAFRTGSIPAHITGSRYWVKNKGPIVENYIGFIETYRDPMGFRGEWEGFVAVVNKKMSEKFGRLVSAAEELLPLLPWQSELEKDEFLQPDFTSLDVLAFGSSMLPIGINIPNYDHIRQESDGGFKNVTLGNVMSARNFNERVTFLTEGDQSPFQNTIQKCFQIQVGLHELLGHGSGKLLQENEDGSLNFSKEQLHVFDNTVQSWYKPWQTWDSVFSDIASSYEECRAECVGIYLCSQPKVLDIFGYDPKSEEAMDVVYINWLNMARAGLMALLYYTPEKKFWGQAHMRARFAILRVMLEAGEGFCEIKGFDESGKTNNFSSEDVAQGRVKEGEEGVHLVMNRSKIESVGIPAVGLFLEKLQVYKSTADYKRGKELFDYYTTVPDHWLPLRDLVVAKRKPRSLMVQPVLEKENDGDVKYRSFDASVESIPSSYVNLFASGLDSSLFQFWSQEKPEHLV
eukprot:gb/GECG01004658.1/.p1 GENE.gb/GECG01004658.1/~~gb/GECG01004658.1/.p1  ORF type:complete len:831 (+),score=106.82 gb/GECG01004658.1/:1-2493(+)